MRTQCLATVIVAAGAGMGIAFVLDLILGPRLHPVVSDSYTF